MCAPSHARPTRRNARMHWDAVAARCIRNALWFRRVQTRWRDHAAVDQRERALILSAEMAVNSSVCRGAKRLWPSGRALFRARAKLRPNPQERQRTSGDRA